MQDSGNSGTVFGNGADCYDPRETQTTTHLRSFSAWLPPRARIILHRPRPKMHFTQKECLEDLRRDGTSIYRVASTCFFVCECGCVLCVCMCVCVWECLAVSVPIILTGHLGSRQGFHGRGTAARFNFAWTLRNGHWDHFCPKTGNKCFACVCVCVWIEAESTVTVQYHW